ncbi:hypothetical protein [Streptomyces sp. NPDC017202]|uniref:hypothetical protein n=1 Tax=Streptomyces sp. NPDC017202 TaxID=3364981 RepID=UPI0037AEB264
MADPARADGTTLLDEVWARAAFGGKGALVGRVRSVAAAWVAAGLLGRADGERGDTARSATFVP